MSNDDSAHVWSGRRLWAYAALIAVAVCAVQGYTAVLNERETAALVGRAEGPNNHWHVKALLEFAQWAGWLMLAPAIFFLARRYPIHDSRWLRNLVLIH